MVSECTRVNLIKKIIYLHCKRDPYRKVECYAAVHACEKYIGLRSRSLLVRIDNENVSACSRCYSPLRNAPLNGAFTSIKIFYFAMN